ncbi:MAG: glycosyltransferase [bacterium]|nr:glycosyltransferase [bacterium]
MKVLMLSTDENIFKEGSEVLARIVDYGKLVEELHVVIKSSQKINKVIGNIFLYSTNSFGVFYFWNAYRISSSIIRNWKLEIKNCVITCQDPFELGLVGCFLKFFKSVPLQMQVHTDFLSPYFKKGSFKNKIRVILARRIIKRADNIRVVSERIKNSLKAKSYKLKARIDVLPIFIDTQKIKDAPVNIDLHKKYPNKFIVLMASRLTKEKNIGLAIEAMVEIAKKYPQALLLVVGNGPELEKLKAISYKLRANVIFENWSNNLSSYYKTADLFLLTSNYEGYGRTVIEATGAGLPVVMTDVGIAIGSVYPVGSKRELIKQLGILVESKEKRLEIFKSQEKFLSFYNSKEDYLNKIKQSWQNCFL